MNYKLEEGELLPIKSDIVFHYLFNEENMKTIEWLVMNILNCKYEDIHNKVTVDNSRIAPLAIDNKQKYLDLIVHYREDIIVIELNNDFDGNYTRNVIYAMNAIVNSYIREMDRLIGERKRSNDDYKMKRVRGILVNLNWLRSKEKIKVLKRKEEQVLKYPVLGEDDSDFLLKIININLYKYRNLCYNEIEKEEKVWKLFTIHQVEELREYQNDEMLKRYFDELVKLSSNEEIKKMVWSKELDDYFWETTHVQPIIERAKEKAIKEAQEQVREGIEQKEKEIILNMHQQNFSNDIIAKCLNLSTEKIEKIIKEKDFS